MVLAGEQASVLRDLPRRARYRRPRSIPGGRRVRAGHPDAAEADRQGDGPRRRRASRSPTGRSNPNPHVREVPGYVPVRGSGPYNEGVRQDDGTYLLGVLPGPGAVIVRTAKESVPAGLRRSQGFLQGQRDKKPDQAYGSTAIETASSSRPAKASAACRNRSSAAIVLVNPPEDSGPIAAEAVLERDRKREVRVLGPDGEAPGRGDRRGRGCRGHEDAGRDDRLGAQPDASQAIHLPPRRPQARRLPAGAGRRGRALHGPDAALGHDRRPTGRCAGPAAAQGPPDDHRLGGCDERPGPRHPARRQHRRPRAASASRAWSPASHTTATRWARRPRRRASAS